MREIHVPHHRIEGIKDFLLHLFTITVGLLIALGLEGLVEWQHHRHLVHDAKVSLHGEIERNANALEGTLGQLHNEEANLRHDVEIMKKLIATGKMPEGENLEISFRIRRFDNVGWKTAQATGASTYMSYDQAQKYADIYATQDQLTEAEDQAARDAIVSMAPFVNSEKNDPDPTAAEAKAINEKIGVLEGQLMLVDSLMQALDQAYRKFLAENPKG